MTVSPLKAFALAMSTSLLLVAGSGIPRAGANAATDETDRFALEQADATCRNGGSTEEDFRSFFDAFVLSAAVRQKYSAPEIHYSGGRGAAVETLTPQTYSHFPVQRVDYDYKPVNPARAGDEGEYLDLQFNQSQSNDFSVEWARIHYDGQSEGGDDMGNRLDANGKPIPEGTHPDSEGQLLFHPAGNCWVFAEDNRW